MRRALLAVLAGAVLAASAAAMEGPYLSGRVNDYANLFDAGTSSVLEKTLKDYEARTGHQIAVLTIASLEGLPIEEFSLQTARTWRLGAKGRDDGILILVARNDRKVRIEVGYGLEGDLPDALAGRIISDVMIPRFRGGAYAAGVQEGVKAVIAALDRSPSSPRVSWVDRYGPVSWKKLIEGLFFLAILLFLDLNEIRTSGFDVSFYLAGALLLPAVSYGLSKRWGLQFGEIVFFSHMLGFPIAKYLMSATAWGRARQTKRTGQHRSDTFFFGGSGSSGGGGGFSGGGGSFGGGGASGSW
jgi:uncharacterized protein